MWNILIVAAGIGWGAAPASGAPASALASWSPDGQWICYLESTRAPETVLATDWLYRRTGASGLAGESADDGGDPSGYSIWGTHIASGTSVLLHRGRGPMTSPAWRPDGRAILYAEISEATAGLEVAVVVQDGSQARRVIATQAEPTRPDAETLRAWTGSSVAWSPDGQEVAVPLVGRTGLAFYRAATGARLRTIDGAREAVWSPDGRWIAFLREGDAPGLYVVDSGLGEPRQLVSLEHLEFQPRPTWERNSRWLQVVRSATIRPRGMPLGSIQLSIARVSLDGDPPTLVHEMVHPPIGQVTAIESVSMAADPDGESLFYLVQLRGQPSRITWLLRGRDEIYKQLPSVDDSIVMGSLAMAPDGQRIAVRQGGSGSSAPLAIVDVETMDRVPLVAGEGSRFAWLGILTGVVQELAASREVRSAAVAPGRWSRRRLAIGGARGEEPPDEERPRVDEQPTVLPLLSDRESDQELARRLDRIAEMGLQVCRPPLGPDETGELARRLNESRLLFHFLDFQPSGANFGQAMQALERVERASESADHRERLMYARAQIELGRGDRDRARWILEEIERVTGPTKSVIEESAGRVVLTEAPDPLAAWKTRFRSSLRRPTVIDDPMSSEPAPWSDETSPEGSSKSSRPATLKSRFTPVDPE